MFLENPVEHIVYLLLGGNQGNVVTTFERAQKLLEKNLGTVKKQSSLYKTAAWGIEDQPDFYNQVLVLSSLLSPLDILQKILLIEQMLGRVRKEKWGQRKIDIDILFYDDLILKEENLSIPHPQIQNRMFTLEPLFEIEPSKVHPVLKADIRALRASCKDGLMVERIKNTSVHV